MSALIGVEPPPAWFLIVGHTGHGSCDYAYSLFGYSDLGAATLELARLKTALIEYESGELHDEEYERAEDRAILDLSDISWLTLYSIERVWQA